MGYGPAKTAVLTFWETAHCAGSSNLLVRNVWELKFSTILQELGLAQAVADIAATASHPKPAVPRKRKELTAPVVSHCAG